MLLCAYIHVCNHHVSNSVCAHYHVALSFACFSFAYFSCACVRLCHQVALAGLAHARPSSCLCFSAFCFGFLSFFLFSYVLSSLLFLPLSFSSFLSLCRLFRSLCFLSVSLCSVSFSLLVFWFSFVSSLSPLSSFSLFFCVRGFTCKIEEERTLSVTLFASLSLLHSLSFRGLFYLILSLDSLSFLFLLKSALGMWVCRQME